MCTRVMQRNIHAVVTTCELRRTTEATVTSDMRFRLRCVRKSAEQYDAAALGPVDTAAYAANADRQDAVIISSRSAD